jgi:hypothetical protein
VHNLQRCDGHRYEDLPGNGDGVTSLNAWPMHEASSVRFINESVTWSRNPMPVFTSIVWEEVACVACPESVPFGSGSGSDVLGRDPPSRLSETYYIRDIDQGDSLPGLWFRLCLCSTLQF